jgi:hypothetical protein
MDLFRSDMMHRDRPDRLVWKGGIAAIFGILFLWISSLLVTGIASATTIYSYVDDRGTPILTDNFESIPERYRAKVQVTEQAPKDAPDHSMAAMLQQKITGLAHSTDGGLGKFIPNISGLTHYQSQVLSLGSIAAVICLIARTFTRSQALRFMSLWCLIMLGLIVPALVFTSQDAALDRVTGQAGQIQEKQQSHLKGAL